LAKKKSIDGQTPEEIAKAILLLRKQNYHKVFSGPVGEEVLKDLAQFCRATESTFHSDPRLHAVLEGRREVWLRIQEHLQMNQEQLWKLKGTK